MTSDSDTLQTTEDGWILLLEEEAEADRRRAYYGIVNGVDQRRVAAESRVPAGRQATLRRQRRRTDTGD